MLKKIKLNDIFEVSKKDIGMVLGIVSEFVCFVETWIRIVGFCVNEYVR